MPAIHSPEIVAFDAGGTMTDSFLVDSSGEFVIGKALTNRGNEGTSYLESLNDAGGAWGLTSRDIHRRMNLSIYTGTGMLNTVLTRTAGQKVGMLVTRGLEGMVRNERALTWLGQSIRHIFHQSLHRHNQLLMDPQNVKPITERICGGSYWAASHIAAGTPLVPLAEMEVERAIVELLDDGVTSIGICFMNSHVAPAHERMAGEIARAVVAKQGRATPVLLSSDICPVARVENRFQSLLIECYAGEHTRAQLRSVEGRAKAEGYRNELMTMLAYGGTATTRYPRMYETIISGPIGGMLGAKAVGDLLGEPNLLCSDMGGTSWDVGVIVDGIIGIRKEPEFVGRRLNLPMVAIESFGAGTGSCIRVDAKLKRVEFGPESAGADVGVCFRSSFVTIGDVDVVLGYLNPDNFLGGKVQLDRKRAEEALRERVAAPLGLDLFEACTGVLDLLHSSMRDSLSVNLSNRGYNFGDYTLLVYGGGGPLHMWGVTEGVPFKNVLTVPWAAAFSAYGNATGDYIYRQHKGVDVLLPTDATGELKMMMGQLLNTAWDEMENRIVADFAESGFHRDQVALRRGVYARYLGQLESWECPVPVQRVHAPEAMDRVTGSFDHVYSVMLPRAAAFREAGYQITEVFVEGVVPKVKPVIPQYELAGQAPPRQALKARRQVYHARHWQEFDIWDMDSLKAGNSVPGPAVIEHSMSSFVIPPNKKIDLDDRRFMWYSSQVDSDRNPGALPS
ncbi:MAG: hydantoinase/oxoprolinase family protein [Gammaproteobacteria bacterium]|nr:MAG: hydantoinase/oxoprolinase family protein [Gammaproteobacteria bacterium]